MIIKTEHSIPKELLETALQTLPEIDYRITLNEPKDRFFYDEHYQSLVSRNLNPLDLKHHTRLLCRALLSFLFIKTMSEAKRLLADNDLNRKFFVVASC